MIEGEVGVLGSLGMGGNEHEDCYSFEGKLGHDKLLAAPDKTARLADRR